LGWDRPFLHGLTGAGGSCLNAIECILGWLFCKQTNSKITRHKLVPGGFSIAFLCLSCAVTQQIEWFFLKVDFVAHYVSLPGYPFQIFQSVTG
jgi:hypothetical protein